MNLILYRFRASKFVGIGGYFKDFVTKKACPSVEDPKIKSKFDFAINIMFYYYFPF